jgi:hypothetical protein
MSTWQPFRSLGHLAPRWIVVGLAVLLLPTPSLVAQHSPLLERPVVGIELFRPHVRDSEGISTPFWSSGTIVTFAHPVGGRSAVSVELPMAWGSQRYEGVPGLPSESGQALGNPEVTFSRALDAPGTLTLTLGGRLPLSKDFGDKYTGRGIGMLADPTRLDRWGEDMGTIFVGVEASRTTERGVRVTGRLSPGYWYLTGRDDRDGEFMAHYGLAASRNGESLFGGLELAGLAYLGDDAEGFSDRTIHRLEGELGRTFGRMTLAGFGRITLKDWFADDSRYTMGARIRVPLR